MIYVDPKVIAAVHGEYRSPDRWDNLPTIISMACEVVRDPFCPQPAREQLTRLIREASDLLQAIRMEPAARTSDTPPPGTGPAGR